MNLLIDELPHTVTIGGKEYSINTDFRASILFELLIQDEDIPDQEKIIMAINVFFQETVPHHEDVKEIFQAILWFYQCGRTDKDQRLVTLARREEEATEHNERAYSFDYDDEYIYAAFLQQYKIDLIDAEMHWWKFRALFKGLDHNCEFVKIMGYRSTKITSDMSKTEKAFIRKMKSIHALPASKKERQETEALMDALMNGGDLTGILNDEGGVEK